MKRKIPIILATALLSTSMTGCANDVEASSTSMEGILPGGCVIDKPIPCDGGVTLSDGNNNYAVPPLVIADKTVANNALDIFRTLYQNTEDKEANLLLSPTSLQSALALLVDASNKSENIRTDLETFFGMTIDELECALQNLQATQFDWREEPADEAISEDEPVEDKHKNVYLMANSLWVSEQDKPIAIRRDYLDKIYMKYRATADKANLQTMEGIDKLNAWVNDKTFGFIPSILSEPTNARAILLNTVYFDCAWAKVFEPEDTIQDFDFNLSNGEKVKVDMMYSSENADYIQIDGAEGVRINYEPNAFLQYGDAIEPTNRFSFIALLPTEDKTLEDVLVGLNQESLHTLTTMYYDADVNVKLPKFKFSNTTNLSDLAKTLGITSAFDPANAHIDILENMELYVSDIVQKAKIDVSEGGTEAAAVTGIMMLENAVMMPDAREVKNITFDKPFIYMLVDNINETPVFIGVMNNPTVEE